MIRKSFLWTILPVFLFMLQGCGPLKRLEAVPAEKTLQAQIPGIPNVRYWVDKDLEPFARDAMILVGREKACLERTGRAGPMPPANFLAISGGGDNGAFGAGLLLGWTQSGTRPEFKVVTGVSTGALIAPFAFLGPEYDDKLKTVYTTISPKDVVEPRSFLAAITSDALADNRPLWELLPRYVDAEMLAKIAREYNEKGRALLVATTNLDARRPVVWNMGAIAASGHPKALELFRRIMLASAAIPGAFPPVLFDVEIDGKPYQEMHVDGGAMAQVFLYPPRLMASLQANGSKVPERERHVYVIRNARLDPDWQAVERSTMTIAGRAINSLIHTQGIGDLYRIYLTAQRDGLDFNLAYIGEDFNAPHKEEFDNGYMRALYDYGYQRAVKGYPWQKAPPGLLLTPPAEAKESKKP